MNNLKLLWLLLIYRFFQFVDQLLGSQGILLNLLELKKPTLTMKNPLQNCLLALKCIASLVLTVDEAKNTEELEPFVKKKVSSTVVSLLMTGSTFSEDEFLYCKVCVAKN